MKSFEPHSILAPLELPRRQLARRRLLAGCLKTFAGLSLAILVLQAVSWLIPIREKPAAMCVFSLLMVSGGILFLLWLRVLFRPPSMMRIARLVEKSHPEFKDSLVCAVELVEKPLPDLNPVETALLHDVSQKLGGLNLSIASLSRGYMLRRLVTAGGIGVLLGVLALQTQVVKKAVYAWGQEAGRGLVVKPGNTELARGTDLDVLVNINRWDRTALIEIAEKDGNRRYEMHSREGRVGFTFYEVDESFSYRVLTPDLASPWYRADVYTPPALKEVSCEINPPAYTGLPAAVYSDLSDCSMLEGSRVTLRIYSAVPGKIWLEDNEEVRMVGQAVEDISGSILPVTTPLTVHEEKSIRLYVEDAAGRKSQGKRAVFSVYPDAIPVVEILLPKKEAILRPDESLFVEARAMDDFGLEDVTLHISVGGRRELVFRLYDGGGATDLRLQKQLTSQGLGTEAGDVVALFVTATDNKTPEGQTGRSAIRFVEIRPEITPRDAPGKQMPRVDVQRIIAELRRLIALTYGITTPAGAGSGDDKLKLVTGLGDLRVLITRQMEELRAQAGWGEAAAIEPWYNRGGELVEEARRYARLPNFSVSVKSQEKALTLFTKLAQELMKNQSSKGDDKPQKGQDAGKSSQQKEGGKRGMSLAEAMNMLRQTRVELSRLADEQAAWNQRLSRLKKDNTRELNEQAQSQQALADATDQVKKNLEKAGFLNELTEQVGKAHGAMGETTAGLKENDLEQAGRAGLRARMELLNAALQAETGLRQLAALQIRRLSSQMNDLANAEEKLRNLSREADEQESVSRETRDLLRTTQEKIGAKAEDLLQAGRETGDEMAESFPEAGESLRAALAGQHAGDLTRAGRRAETALLYKKFQKAATYQKEMADGMRSLSQEIAVAADQLPTLTPTELMNLLNQLEQTRAMLKSDAQKEAIQRQVNQMAERLAETGRQMNDLQFMEISGKLGDAVDQESGSGKFPETDRLLQAAGKIVRRELRRLHVEEKATLTRKLARPPEKYRRQVEEYFKELSED